MEKEKQMPLRQAWKLQWRAMKLLHGLDPQMFPAITLSNLVSAVIPFVLIYFSARILGELAGARQPEQLWLWVWITVAAGGVLALLKAMLVRWEATRQNVFYHLKESLFSDKLFQMDFADIDKQATYDLRTQIVQSENWMGWGLPKVPFLYAELIKAATGILSAVALTASLFIAKIPAGAGALALLNSPLFLPALLGLMLLLSALSGRLETRYGMQQAALAGEARLGNRLFGYFGFLGPGERDVDVRIYDQYKISEHYLAYAKKQSFGPQGPFARLARRRGGVDLALSAGLPAVFTGVIYVFTCLKALAGAFGVGSVTQYVGAATSLSGNLTTLFSRLGELRSNGEFLNSVFSFLDIPNAMYRGTLTTEKRLDRNYEIEFKNVSFRYPGTETWALKDVSVRFKVGSRMAIVGENGSGKTTFIKLLCRLYDPQEGEILLNGIDIKKYDYRDYMDIFSVVFQDFQLLSQPLGDNVAGSRNYDEARVKKALADAGFGERLKTMPEGLNTLLYRQYGENGVEVSGGEAQKIAIARALYRDAPFLILDEPTAALDPMAEAEIYAQLNRIVDDRTAVYISHRLSSCRFCDEILVFDAGQIVQSGPHEALLAQADGKYHALWNAQAQYYASNEG